ncbi:FliM/FliN family flagellar motor switch protein [Agaribacter flavus]|uniref:Flagellar motor switch protein FliN n=1 Tax=Agaribacter flavus TaxID=1902781 RepID=A0ABV7FMJ9_9ALTE
MTESTAKRVELSEVKTEAQDKLALSQRDFSIVKSVPVNVEVKLGKIEVSIERLFSLKAGETLEMDKDVNQPIDLVLNGDIIATGNLVAIDGNFGIEIIDLMRES